MTEIKAKQIGSRTALLSASIGTLIAQTIMTFLVSGEVNILKAFLWFTTVNYKLNLFVGITLLFTASYFYGQIAGKQILIRNRNHILVGCLTGILVLITTAFLSSWVGFSQEGIDNIGSNDDPFEDYIVKPFFWVSIIGLIPAILVGIWFGSRIKRMR